MASSVSVIATNHPSQHHHHQQQHHMDRLDAARALLGVSPDPSTSEAGSPNRSRLSTGSHRALGVVQTVQPITSPRTIFQQAAAQQSQESPTTTSATTSTRLPTLAAAARVTFEKPLQQPSKKFQLAPPAVISNGLDALAALASSEQASWEAARLFEQQQQQQQRAAFTLVSANTTTASSSTNSSDDDDSEAMPPPPPRMMMMMIGGGRRRSVSNPEGMEKWAPSTTRRHFVLPASILEEELAEASAAMEAHSRKNSVDNNNNNNNNQEATSSSSSRASPTSSAPISGLMSEEEQANLTPEELLKRARSRLLEDLSEGNLAGEKGVLTLPHSLSKYKEVYNKNGRIGIYTPAERAAIIARFNQKRARRVWNKKIRYNCRKNLADRRMRVKGRFVKRSTEQQARVAVPSPPPKEEDTGNDQDMPDVTDPEAGFCPTEDQPYRRTRRHTIT